jgi:hypothetical protein
MVISPAVSTIDGTNPGFSTFDYNRENALLFDLEMHFLRIKSTYLMPFPVPPIRDPRYRFIDFYWEENFYLRNLTGKGMVNFMDYLLSHKGPEGEEELVDLLGDKAGYDPDDPNEMTLIQQIYKDDGFIGDASTRARMYCIMAQGLHIQEVRECISKFNITQSLDQQEFFLK